MSDIYFQTWFWSKLGNILAAQGTFHGMLLFLAEDTLFWAKIDAPVLEQYHLP